MPETHRAALQVGSAPVLGGMRSRLVLFLGLASIPGGLSGQAFHGPPQTLVYVTAGLGTGSMEFAGQLGLSVHVPVGEVTLRLAGVSDFDILGPSDNASDVALLYGVRGLGPNTWFSLGAGPSIASATIYGRCVDSGFLGFCTSYEVDSRVRPGLAFHATLGWALAKSLGLSVSALGDANAAHSFMGATLNLHLGKLR